MVIVKLSNGEINVEWYRSVLLEFSCVGRRQLLSVGRAPGAATGGAVDADRDLVSAIRSPPSIPPCLHV